MRSILCGSLFIGFSLLGQQSLQEGSAAIARLNTTLTALQNVSADRVILTRQLVDAMMALGEGNRRPSRPTVEGFVDEFISALIGKFTNTQLAMLQRPITEVLRGSTTNLDSASHLRESLASVHINYSRTQAITKRFLAIGEEVRGPDDSPLLGEK